MLQTNKQGGGPEGDPAAAGGGHALHRHPRGVPTQGPQARQHRHPARHHTHQRHTHIRL